MGTRARVLAGILLLAVVAAGVWLLRSPGETGPGSVMPSPSGPVVEPTARLLVEAPDETPDEDPCARAVAGAFVPVELRVPGLGVRRVVGLPREANGATGVPPLTSQGKQLVGWDVAGVRPGAARGNVLLNAHTWPDGSALGNRLLAVLDEGDVVVLRGARGRLLCYRISDRVEVPFDAPGDSYYDDGGPAQVAIAVCSGIRTGPGEWTHRTLWFGRPVPLAARAGRG